MYVRSGLLAAMRRSPLRLIKGLADTKIDCQLWNNLPAEAEISAAAETIDGRDRIGIEDVVLIAIDAVVPVPGVEELEAETERKWMVYSVRCKVVGDVLEDGDAVLGNDGLSRFAE